MPTQNVRTVLLEVIADQTAKREGPLTKGGILGDAARRLGISKNDDGDRGLALLTCWHDLLLSGQLAWGMNLMNPDAPWVHLTARGREMLKHLSRDPSNPDGYLTNLDQRLNLDPVARSYITEALNTYNANCYKATAVMVGGAAERLVLCLRDALVARLTATGKPVAAGLNDWKVKTVRDALAVELEARKKDMPRPLYESFNSYWLAFAEQARRVRNDAGHPESIDPVTVESVHAALLIFPELAKLVADLEKWVNTFYV